MRSTGDGFTRVIGNRKGGERIPSPAGANKIRSELQLLSRIMRKAGCWPDSMKENYIPLQAVDNDIPRALSYEEQERFLAVAGSHPSWEAVWWYAIVALHTTFSSDEMRTLRIGDINLTHQTLSVNRHFGKNVYRRRTIPLESGVCEWALARLIERARTLAGADPHHFLLPFRAKKNSYDPNRPMGETGLRKQFDAVRRAARVEWFKFNGFRHTAITRLAEAGTPIATIMSLSGHVTQKMSAHYTHISEQAQRRALRSAGDFHRKPPMSVQAERIRQQMRA
jgi:integrase